MEINKKRKSRILKSWDDISDFADLHKGKSCFIIGAGPSLAFLNLNDIHKHVVISVNASALLMPWEKGSLNNRFWISNDALCMKWSYFWSHVINANCTKLVGEEWFQHDDKIRGKNFRFFSPRKSCSMPLLLQDNGLCTISSVPSAIDFALLMGCSKIFLIGVDQKMHNGKSHFWQYWDQSKWPQRSDKHRNFQPEQKHQIVVFKKNQNTFNALKELAGRKNAIIKNCSSRSVLSMFEKISLENALKEAE